MIIYDCEIIKGIARKGEPRIEGIEYCDGWRDFENMGISCICAYDYVEKRPRVFLEDNMDDFRELISRTDLVIGFNSLSFDNQLCRANDIDVPNEKSWDLLVEIWKGAGLSPCFQYPSHMGFSLDACGEANFGIKKSGNGAMAPVDWQQGRKGKVIDYCLNDVMPMTKRLVDKVMEQGYIIDPRDQTKTISVELDAL